MLERKGRTRWAASCLPLLLKGGRVVRRSFVRSVVRSELMGVAEQGLGKAR